MSGTAGDSVSHRKRRRRRRRRRHVEIARAKPVGTLPSHHLFLLSAFMVTSLSSPIVSGKGNHGIPQHRVRSSRRVVSYSNSNSEGSSVSSRYPKQGEDENSFFQREKRWILPQSTADLEEFVDSNSAIEFHRTKFSPGLRTEKKESLSERNPEINRLRQRGGGAGGGGTQTSENIRNSGVPANRNGGVGEVTSKFSSKMFEEILNNEHVWTVLADASDVFRRVENNSPGDGDIDITRSTTVNSRDKAGGNEDSSRVGGVPNNENSTKTKATAAGVTTVVPETKQEGNEQVDELLVATEQDGDIGNDVGNNGTDILTETGSVDDTNVTLFAADEEYPPKDENDLGVTGAGDAALSNASNTEEKSNSTESDISISTGEYFFNTANETSTINSTTVVSSASTTVFQPIRIRAFLTENWGGGKYLTGPQRQRLMESILSPAMHAWSAALRVRPVVGNLTVDADQLYDGVSCGPGIDSDYPSVIVPPYHMTEGVPDTDLLVYVSIAFVTSDSDDEDSDGKTEGQEKTKDKDDTGKSQGKKEKNKDDTSGKTSSRAKTETNSGGDGTTNRKEETEGQGNSRTRKSSSPEEPHAVTIWGEFHSPEEGGPQVEASVQQPVFGEQRENVTDCFAMGNSTNVSYDGSGDLTNVTACNKSHIESDSDTFSETENESSTNASKKRRPSCPGTYLASATYCSTDHLDRPVAAMLSFCIDEKFFQSALLERNIITAMHELGHALGFNAQSLAHFRDNNGDPVTPRDENGDVEDVKVECTGVKEGRGNGVLPLPSPDLLQFRETRGGLRVAEIVTPTVLQVVRNHFDCQKLTGAELESESFHPLGETGEEVPASDCISDHWERRLFLMDLMNPIIDSVPFSLRISPLTLAYFIDSGWYQVDLSRTAYVAGWGRGAGCDFVNEKCITSDGEVSVSNKPFFCNDVLKLDPGKPIEEIHGCSADFSRKAVCGMSQYDTSLPAEFEYFANVSGLGSDFGGNDAELDYCPMYDGFSNGLCKEKSNEELLKVHGMEKFGEINSRCVAGALDGSHTAFCLPIACVIEDRTLRIKVDGKWRKCEFGGQMIPVWSDPKRDYVVCPDPWRTCPTFYCPRNCLGTDGGRCQYKTGQCICHKETSIVQHNDGSIKASTSYVPCGDTFGGSNQDDAFFYDSVARVESSLSEIYVYNETVLENDGRDLFDRVFRLFANMSTGDVIGFVASCLVIILLIWLVFPWLSKFIRSSKRFQNICSLRIRIPSRQSLVQQSEMDAQASMNPDKDKAVASMLLHLRIHNPRAERRLRRARRQRRMRERVAQMRQQNQALEICREANTESKDGHKVKNSFGLPPLPEERGGRVLAIIHPTLRTEFAYALPQLDTADARSLAETDSSGFHTVTTGSITSDTFDSDSTQHPFTSSFRTISSNDSLGDDGLRSLSPTDFVNEIEIQRYGGTTTVTRRRHLNQRNSTRVVNPVDVNEKV